MRPRHALLSLVLAALVACGGGAEEAEEAPVDTTAQDDVQFVPDSTIEREVTTRLDADPRFDKEGVDIEVHARDGNVTLLGTVPTRMEMSFAREVAISAPGVRKVFLDSLEILSEPEPVEEREREPQAAT
ncbi:MAG: BON domain-containing protein [Gemmatimonadota bacterium]|nr:BON domain-containing protein [Gemmatimonadota bacterium]